MASQTDEAERRVREQRALIERKVTALESRVSEDVTLARSRVTYHVTHAADVVPGGTQLLQQVEQHPTAAMAGGLGLGVAAGLMTGSGSSSASRDDDDRGRNSRADSGSMMGAMASSLLMPLRPLFEDAAKDLVSGFKDRSASSSGSPTSNPRAEATRDRSGGGSA